jgi:signal transduction histidine kinase
MAGPSSLHRYLLTRILLVVVPIVLLGVAVHWRLERRLLQEQFDVSLVEEAAILATLVTQHGNALKLEFADEFMPQYSRAEHPSFFEIWYPDQRPLERSYTLQGENLPFLRGTLEDPQTFTATLASGATLRGVAIEFPARLGSDLDGASPSSVVIAVAAETAELEATLRRGYKQVALTGCVSAVGIAAFVVLALRRGVHLLERAVGEVERITPGSLQRPLDERAAPEEIQPLIGALNRCLRLIGGFVERERRFTADVAHELRTPIAELRAAADVAQRWPDEESKSRLADHAGAIALQMGALVESLLELAVLEGADGGGEVKQLDLAHLVACQAEHVGRGHPSAKEVELHLPPALALASRPELWEVVVRNLLDNALSHSPPGAHIDVRLRADGDGAHLSVRNPAGSLDPASVARCTERLWRKDPREGTDRHFGLGLSLVQAACAKLGHALSVSLEQGTFHATISPVGSPTLRST